MFTLLRVRATGAYEQPLCPTLLHHLVQWCNHYQGDDISWKDSAMSRKSWVNARILSPVPSKAKISFPLKTCKTGASKTYRICSSRFFPGIKYICQHQSDQDCNEVCMDTVARKEPRFLHLFTTLLLNRKYNPLPPIYYCKSDTFSVHRFIFLEKLFAGILDYFGPKLWRTNTP